MYPRWNDKAFMCYCSINHHRRWDVRNETRATFIARAYIAGIPYKSVEQKRKVDNEPNFQKYILPRVFAMVVKYGKREALRIGNMDAKRDWGFAKEYVEGMWRMLQADKPEDFVLATGETVTVREFVQESFRVAGINIEWKGKAGTVDEYGVDTKTGETIVKVDPSYFRPTEVELLIGDPTKAREKLGWVAKTKFKELCKIMTEADLKLVEKNLK
jgi:GDP-mannose 4,6-dehydratase